MTLDVGGERVFYICCTDGVRRVSAGHYDLANTNYNILINYITYDDMWNGGILSFQMGPQPNKQRNNTTASAPYSVSTSKYE